MNIRTLSPSLLVIAASVLLCFFSSWGNFQAAFALWIATYLSAEFFLFSRKRVLYSCLSLQILFLSSYVNLTAWKQCPSWFLAFYVASGPLLSITLGSAVATKFGIKFLSIRHWPSRSVVWVQAIIISFFWALLLYKNPPNLAPVALHLVYVVLTVHLSFSLVRQFREAARFFIPSLVQTPK